MPTLWFDLMNDEFEDDDSWTEDAYGTKEDYSNESDQDDEYYGYHTEVI